MKGEGRPPPADGKDPGSWFDDPDVLMTELKGTQMHWADLPRIPGYDRIVEIRRGGQGVVYRARQRSTNRPVAIKVLLDGVFASEASRHRFQREVESIARLRHPCIVPVYDSGLTPDGRLYYVMELVEGLPLDEACPELRGQEGIAAALRLFIKVCEAVKHAHQHGVIHRDLKPGNILVDSGGEPHVLDFGLAKQMEEPAAEGLGPLDSVSRTGQFFGSLAWASPEQIEAAPDRIDLRSDIYSLGAILYRLLTGRLPHPPSGSLRGMLNAIAKDPPPRPRSLRPSLPADLETIVLRCLAKEPDRRYQGAGELKADLERFLKGEPIDAKRDRPAYVLWKTLNRHRTVALLAGLLLLSLIGFAAAMSVLYPRALRAEKEAMDSMKEAMVESGKAGAVRDFLTDMLSRSDPFASQGRDPTVREVLDEAAGTIAGRFCGYPLVEAEIRAVMGNAYYNLGRPDEAAEQDRKALALLKGGPEESGVAAAKLHHNLAMIALDHQEFDQAEARLDEAQAIAQKHRDEDPVVYAFCLHTRAELRQAQFRLDEAGQLFEQAHALLKQCSEPGDPRYVVHLIQWAGFLTVVRKPQEAVARLEEASAIVAQFPEAHPALRAAVLFYMGLARFNTGELDQAEAALEAALETRQEMAGGESSSRTAEILTQMGHVRREQGRIAEAEQCYWEALYIYRQTAGPQSAESASGMWNVAQAQWLQGERDQAEELFREALAIRKAVYGPSHHMYQVSLIRLGLLLCEADLREKALPLFEEAASLQEDSLGPENPLTAHTRALEGECLARLGRTREAEAMLRDSLKVLDEQPGPDGAYRDQARRALEEIQEIR